MRTAAVFVLFELLFAVLVLVLFVTLVSYNDDTQQLWKMVYMSPSNEGDFNSNIRHSLSQQRRRRLNVAEAVSIMDGKIYTFGSSNMVTPHKLKQQVTSHLMKNAPNKKNNNKKLKAVLHIGPQKTATTAIQHTIKLMEEQLQEKDNFYRARDYFVNYLAASFIDCFIPDGYHRRHINFCNITNTYNNIRDIGKVGQHNIIISTEDFSLHTIDIQKLKEFFVDAGYDEENIIIVMYYRRFYEWFVSLDYQGRTVHPFELRHNIAHHFGMEQIRHSDENEKYTTGIYERYNKFFSNVHVINMHAHKDDVRRPFFCNILLEVAGATHACEEYARVQLMEQTQLDAKIVATYKNKRSPQIYEEIAYWALQQNMWSNQTSNTPATKPALTIPMVTNFVRNYHEYVMNKTQYDFPAETITCIQDGQYDWILTKSLEFEERLFPEYYKNIGRQEIIQHFPTLKNDFCSVDPQMVLSVDHDKWYQFFKSL